MTIDTFFMKKRIFSGVQPSGRIHLGNYLGAIKQWVELQNDFSAIFCVVDLHAITVPQDPETLRRKTLEAVKAYLALGVDPEKAHIFVQSQVPEHSELAWILNTIAKNGDLTKMTQFKDKSFSSWYGRDFKENDDFDDPEIAIDYAKQSSESISEKLKQDISGLKDSVDVLLNGLVPIIKENSFEMAKRIYALFKDRFNASGVGLFDYPVLMAGDILLYDTEVVPVGKDQVQHIEFSRTLARRFNKKFGETFVVPQSRVMKEGARIMGLDDPTKKMSKSAGSEYNFIALDDDVELARKKVMKAVTDSEGTIAYTDDRPGVKNLVTIFALLENTAPEAIVSRYEGRGYADFKRDLADAVVTFLAEYQKKYNAISDELALTVLEQGRQFVSEIAKKKMTEVKEKVGFLV